MSCSLLFGELASNIAVLGEGSHYVVDQVALGLETLLSSKEPIK